MLIVVSLKTPSGHTLVLHQGESRREAVKYMQRAARPTVEVPVDYLMNALRKPYREVCEMEARGGGMLTARAHPQWPGEAV